MSNKKLTKHGTIIIVPTMKMPLRRQLEMIIIMIMMMIMINTYINLY